MTRLNIYSSLPSIDLHGETGDISRILVKDFINDNVKLKNNKIIIIHGIGKGIVKKAIYNELKNNKLVKLYKQDNFNPGMTIVELDV